MRAASTDNKRVVLNGINALKDHDFIGENVLATFNGFIGFFATGVNLPVEDEPEKLHAEAYQSEDKTYLERLMTWRPGVKLRTTEHINEMVEVFAAAPAGRSMVAAKNIVGILPSYKSDCKKVAEIYLNPNYLLAALEKFSEHKAVKLRFYENENGRAEPLEIIYEDPLLEGVMRGVVIMPMNADHHNHKNDPPFWPAKKTAKKKTRKKKAAKK